MSASVFDADNCDLNGIEVHNTSGRLQIAILKCDEMGQLSMKQTWSCRVCRARLLHRHMQSETCQGGDVQSSTGQTKTPSTLPWPSLGQERCSRTNKHCAYLDTKKAVVWSELIAAGHLLTFWVHSETNKSRNAPPIPPHHRAVALALL